MCGRFNITSDPLAAFLMAYVGAQYDGMDNFNLAPTETVEVLRMGASGTPEIVPMRWWLTPFWAKELTSKYAMFNARSETAASSAAFKTPYRKRRCVVPISGFYEWSRQQDSKVPYLISPNTTLGENTGSALLLAGLWDSWQMKESGEELLSFTILTTQAHTDLTFVHHRQPVILNEDEALAWLDMETATSELSYLFASRLPVELQATPVSSHVNNARHKDEGCVTPVGDAIVIQRDVPGLH